MELIKLIQEITGDSTWMSSKQAEQKAVELLKAQRKELEELRGIAEHYEPFRLQD